MQTNIEAEDALHHDVEEKRTPEQLREDFSSLLSELEETPTELARRMKHLGDHRSQSAILRGIQRMASGSAGVSGEMLVVATLLVRQQRVRDRRFAEMEWVKFPNGVHAATQDGFDITLTPQSKGRWHVHLRYQKTGFSPAWPAWQPTLEAAKKKALTCLFDAQNEMTEIAASRK